MKTILEMKITFLKKKNPLDHFFFQFPYLISSCQIVYVERPQTTVQNLK